MLPRQLVLLLDLVVVGLRLVILFRGSGGCCATWRLEVSAEQIALLKLDEVPLCCAGSCLLLLLLWGQPIKALIVMIASLLV